MSHRSALRDDEQRNRMKSLLGQTIGKPLQTIENRYRRSTDESIVVPRLDSDRF